MKCDKTTNNFFVGILQWSYYTIPGLIFFSRNTEQWFTQFVTPTHHFTKRKSAGDATCKCPRITPFQPLSFTYQPHWYIRSKLASYKTYSKCTKDLSKLFVINKFVEKSMLESFPINKLKLIYVLFTMGI